VKAVLVGLLLLIAWTTGIAQSLSFKFGTPFQRSDLDVRWNVPSNGVPDRVWVYRLFPNHFSSATMEFLRSLGPFTDQDRVRSNSNEVLFIKSSRLPNLFVSYRFGQIRYQTATPTFTNLVKNVPPVAESAALALSFFNIVGIKSSDLTKKDNGSPDLSLSVSSTEYYVNHQVLTNIESDIVDFRRCVDGGEWVGAETGGDGQVQFGEYGKPSRIWLSWRKIQRYESYQTASSSTIMSWIRHGRAVQNMIPMDAEPINWGTIKSLTITKAKLCYYAGAPSSPSDWLTPFIALWTTVDRGHGKIEVEIDCPIIDMTKPPLPAK
jgi:hypothetical protein